MKSFKAAQYGCGKMSKYTMRYILEQGGEIIYAFDCDKKVIGCDIGDIIGCGKTGVKVQNAAEASSCFSREKPNICIITTMSLLRDVRDALMICALAGVNAITTCEEAFYPQNSSPQLYAELDSAARAGGCTLTGSGYQDIFWGNLITSIAGATHNLSYIRGSSSYNVEDYGIALARAHGAGLTPEQFKEQMTSDESMSDDALAALVNSGNFTPSYMWNVNGWLCSKLGFTVARQRQSSVMHAALYDMRSETLKMTIPAGCARGMSAVVTTETAEGVTIKSECIGRVYTPDETDINKWKISGEPDTEFTISRPATVELTCASIVNRIPDVINARPGYVTTDKLPELCYRTPKRMSTEINIQG